MGTKTKTRTNSKDRRDKQRFPIRRELRYKLIEDSNVVSTGTGYSLDLSSGGTAIYADSELREGAFVELSISWPVLLDDTCPMRFIAFGRGLRSCGQLASCAV